MIETIKLNTVEQWEALKSELAPPSELMIFKYSPVCSISSVVEDDLDSWLSGLPENTNIKCAKLDVIEAKAVSSKIAAELNVKHESPQLIWLTGDLKIKWTASHYDITKTQLDFYLTK